MLYSRFPPAIYFTHGSVYMSIPVSQFIPPPLPPHRVHTSVLYVCVSIPALQIGIFQSNLASEFQFLIQSKHFTLSLSSSGPAQAKRHSKGMEGLVLQEDWGYQALSVEHFLWVFGVSLTGILQLVFP